MVRISGTPTEKTGVTITLPEHGEVALDRGLRYSMNADELTQALRDAHARGLQDGIRSDRVTPAVHQAIANAVREATHPDAPAMQQAIHPDAPAMVRAFRMGLYDAHRQVAARLNVPVPALPRDLVGFAAPAIAGNQVLARERKYTGLRWLIAAGALAASVGVLG